jgi:hypothetical protein
MSRIPWYYIWSEKYELFHTTFQDITSRIFPKLREQFAIRPLYIEQHEFSNKLSKDPQTHPFAGCNLKIDALINCIEANMNRHFLFTDIDIIIRQPTLMEMLDPFKDHDMVFMTEDTNSKAVNIGFCYIKASSSTLDFWKTVQRLVKQEGGHDQDIANQLIKSSPHLKTGLFSPVDIISQKTCTADTNFKIIQILSSGGNSPHWQFIEKLYTIPMFIIMTPYNYLISEQDKNDVDAFKALVNGDIKRLDQKN